MKKLEGIQTALVTPFDENGHVDEQSLRNNIRFQLANGIKGFCPLGGTGEPLSLTMDEHRRIIDTVLDEVNGKVPVTVGCVTADQKDIVEIGRYARSAGADYIMLIPPYFINATFRHIKTHFSVVAERCDMPMVLYHGPGRSGVRLTAAQLLELFTDIPAFKAIKETSADIILLTELMRHIPTGFRVLQGLDELLLPTLVLGGHGGIVSLGNLVPATLSALYDAVQAKDLSKAQSLQLELMALSNPVYAEPNPGPLKYAMSLCNRSAGGTREPIYLPDPALQAELKDLISRLSETKAEYRAGN